MYILTNDGELEEGTPLSNEEMEVYKHFKENLTGVGYISLADRNAVGKFMLKHYNMSMRRAADELPDDEKIGLTDPD